MTDIVMNDLIDDLNADVRDLIEWYEEDTGNKVDPLIMIYLAVRLAHNEARKARRLNNVKGNATA